MLTVSEAIAQRRATRKYLDKAIPADVLDRVVHDALEAPSGFNAQQRDIVVITNQETRSRLTEDSGQQQFAAAPVVFVAIGHTGDEIQDGAEILGEEMAEKMRSRNAETSRAQRREEAIREATIAASFLMLAAQSEGLASSPTSGWDEEKVKEAIGLGGRDDRCVALVIAVGYPDEHPEHPGRAANRRVDESYSA